MSRDFSNLSYNLTKHFSKDIKKNGGIYFTPPDTVISSLDIIQAYSKYKQEWCGNILEPSCGSCEYVIELTKRFPLASINAIEYNKIIYDSIVNMKTDMLNIINADFLKYNTNDNIKFDLIVGNPPYYVMKKGDVDKKYYEYFEGRPNIFIIFIIKSLELLNIGGILSFILPLNFLNCLYYNKTRAYISKHFKIISITYCNDKYIETEQETLLFIIEKIDITQGNIDNNEYIIRIKEYIIFGVKENIKILKGLYENSYSLADIGFKVNVGSIVWNQCKDILTDDTCETRLIYSGDIKNNKLTYKKILRCALNLTFPQKVKNSEPHLDHSYEHKTLLIYLNDNDGDTVILDKKNKIWKKVKPKKYKGVCFPYRYHYQFYPKSGIRAVDVYTFI